MNSAEIYLRLARFLLLSLSVHTGLVLYDWQPASEQPGVTMITVPVALLPVSETPPVPAVVDPKPIIEQQQNAQEHVQAAAPAPAADSKTVKAVPVRQRKVAPAARALARDVAPPKKQIHNARQAVETMPSALPISSPAPQPVIAAPEEVTVAVTVAKAVNGSVISPKESAMQDTDHKSRPGPDVSAAPELVEAAPDFASNPLPEYPFLARQKHWQGVVWLLVNVSTEGLVEELRIERSCGHGVLDRAASRTVRQWRFTPARRAGQPMASQVRIPVRFQLEDS